MGNCHLGSRPWENAFEIVPNTHSMDDMSTVVLRLGIVHSIKGPCIIKGSIVVHGLYIIHGLHGLKLVVHELYIFHNKQGLWPLYRVQIIELVHGLYIVHSIIQSPCTV